MKWFKRLLAAVAVLLVIVVTVGLFLPDRVHVERSIVIDAPPERVFPLVNDYRNFNQWSPWYGMDPDARYRFDGPESGVGAKLSWDSDNPDVGSGSQQIVESRANALVRTHLDFGDQGVAEARFTLSPEGTGTRVTWGFDTDFGYNLVGRYFGLLFESMIGPDYEQGLANLKRVAESPPQQ